MVKHTQTIRWQLLTNFLIGFDNLGGLVLKWLSNNDTYLAINYLLSKLTTGTQKQYLKSVQNVKDVINVVLVFLLLTLKRFHTFFLCLNC